MLNHSALVNLLDEMRHLDRLVGSSPQAVIVVTCHSAHDEDNPEWHLENGGEYTDTIALADHLMGFDVEQWEVERA